MIINHQHYDILSLMITTLVFWVPLGLLIYCNQLSANHAPITMTCIVHTVYAHTIYIIYIYTYTYT